MLMAWDQILLAALLASLLALVMLLLFRIRWKGLTLPHVVGLALCAGIGLTLWFFIFNSFSLSSLDFDLPIPLFPVSPEDLSCMVVTGLTAFIYWLVAPRLPGLGKNPSDNYHSGNNQPINNISSRYPRLEWWVWVLPALASLIIDVYFI